MIKNKSTVKEVSHPEPLVKSKRTFVSVNLEIESWESVQAYFEDLHSRKIQAIEELEKWLRDRSELFSVLEEDLAWRYIRMNCDTSDKNLAERYIEFVSKIEPEISRYSNLLDNKFQNTPVKEKLDPVKYTVFVRALAKRMEIFREENIQLISELQVEEQEYGKISSEMSVSHKGKEITLQEAANFIKDPGRDIREKYYRKVNERRHKDAARMQDLLSKLIKKRQQVAKNAGFTNFRDYKWADLGRFDYTVKDVQQFHESIRTEICPLAEKILEKRKEKLSLDALRPWDLDVDYDLMPPLKPFKEVDEFVSKTIQSFRKINPGYGNNIARMNDGGFLDLESRIGKAPGGFNYPLYESNIPFIYMNATGNLRDLETMFHEGGHAIHSFLSSKQDLIEYKELPAEVAELASMSMELISMDQWHIFFDSKTDLLRAKRSQLEGVIQVLPWIASVDKFQHWLYTNPDHSIEERNHAWLEVINEFGSKIVDWSGLDQYLSLMWQKQLHIFEVPFYYIEYGMAQLGAIAMWKQYRENPEKALKNYERALSLGYSVPIPEIYNAAGISFDFSVGYVQELIGFVADELAKLQENE